MGWTLNQRQPVFSVSGNVSLGTTSYVTVAVSLLADNDGSYASYFCN